MFEYYFTFRAVTPAQHARSVLHSGGVAAAIGRAPRQLSMQGCGYVLEVAAFDGAQAFALFLANGVRVRRVFRRYENGIMEEAGHDLL